MIRIKEALERVNANRTEGKITLIDVAREIWPESETKTQQMSISNLANNKTATMRIEWVPTLCKALECDANFLFNVVSKESNNIDFFKMDLHKTVQISEDIQATSVPGGWIYEDKKLKNMVFVPRN
jgi:hypothetical protein